MLLPIASLLLFATSSLGVPTPGPNVSAADSHSKCSDHGGGCSAEVVQGLHKMVVTTTDGRTEAVRIAKEKVRNKFGSHTPLGATYVRNDGWFTHYVNVRCSCRGGGAAVPAENGAASGGDLFTVYAPPQAWGPRVIVGSHIGKASFVISAKATGNANIVGEVTYYDEHNVKRTVSFGESIVVRTGDSVANVRVRFKSVGLTGTGVRVQVK